MILARYGILAFAPPEGQPSALVQFVPFILIFVVFYFLIFAPMRRRQKKHEETLASLKAGDHVVTNGGLHGKIVGVTRDVIQLRIADKVHVDLSKSAVAQKIEPGE